MLLTSGRALGIEPIVVRLGAVAVRQNEEQLRELPLELVSGRAVGYLQKKNQRTSINAYKK